MTDRDVGAVPGASFWHDGESLMFRYVIDENNVIGPRAATAIAPAEPEPDPEPQPEPEPDDGPEDHPAKPRRRSKA